MWLKYPDFHDSWLSFFSFESQQNNCGGEKEDIDSKGGQCYCALGGHISAENVCTWHLIVLKPRMLEIRFEQC